MTDNKSVLKAEEALKVEQAKLNELEQARGKQYQALQELQQRGKVNLSEVSVTQLLSLSPQAMTDSAEVTAAKTILEEIERRVRLQEDQVRGAEFQIRLAQARILNSQCWDLETELMDALRPALKKWEEVKQRQVRITELIGRSRQTAVNGYVLNGLPLENVEKDFAEHRRTFTKQTALNDGDWR